MKRFTLIAIIICLNYFIVPNDAFTILPSWAFMVPPTRFEFPNPSGNVGFILGSNQKMQLTTDPTKAFMFWNTTSNMIQFNRLYYPWLGVWNSICDMPTPQHIKTDGYMETSPLEQPNLSVWVGYSFATEFKTRSGASTSMALFFVDIVENGLIILTAAQINSTAYVRTAVCLPEVSSATPLAPFSAGSWINIKGNFFGMNSQVIDVKIGSYPCESPILLANQTLLRCLASGSGNNLPINVTVNSKSSNGKVLVSFDKSCKLTCGAYGYPDPTCKNCIGKPNGPPLGFNMTLENLLFIMTHALNKVQLSMDQYFLNFSENYKDPKLQMLRFPRYTLPKVQIDLPVAIVAVEPDILVDPLTNHLGYYQNITVLSINYVTDEGRWERDIIYDDDDATTIPYDYSYRLEWGNQ